MLQPFVIKLERDEEERTNRKKKRKSSQESPQCTCSSESVSEGLNQLASPPSSKKHRQILVNFGLRRRKIFNLKSKKDSLHQLFLSFIEGDPAFSKLLDKAYVVLQQYNPKFGTYVDVDDSKHLCDGSVVKAVFFPTRLERDDDNPGCIKTKGHKTNENSSSDVILIDSSDDDQHHSSDLDLPICRDGSTSQAHLASEKNAKTSKRKNKKRSSQEQHDNPESIAKCTEKVTDPREIEIKMERNSGDKLAGSTSVISDNQQKQVQPAAVAPSPRAESTNVFFQADSTTRDLTPPSLDIAVSQNHKQIGSVPLRYNSEERASQKMDHQGTDAITQLSELCGKEMVDPPKYSLQSFGNSFKCRVYVSGFTFCGSGTVFQSAKQNAASLALQYFLGVSGYSKNEREGEKRRRGGGGGGVDEEEERRRKKWVGEAESGSEGKDKSRNLGNIGHKSRWGGRGGGRGGMMGGRGGGGGGSRSVVGGLWRGSRSHGSRRRGTQPKWGRDFRR